MKKNKKVCWCLFDSETGDYVATIKKYFGDTIEAYGVGMSHDGKDTPNYLNFNLADFSELFTGESIASRLLRKLPRPDFIVASPPCESWSHATSINNGNVHWKRFASKMYPQNKFFQLQDIDVQSRFVKGQSIKTFFCRVNGELCVQNTWDIIRDIKPTCFLVENPDNYSWEYVKKYVHGLPDFIMNKVYYSAYEPNSFSPKAEIFASNIKLHLRQNVVYKNGNTILPKGRDEKSECNKNYGARSRIPKTLLKDVFEEFLKNAE